MIFPGGNLLALAQGVIGQQVVQWQKFTGMATNAAGVDVPSFADPVPIAGSFQPVGNTVLQTLGLDFRKNYATFHARAQFTDPERDKTGDRLTYAGKVYSIEAKTPWFAQDGWEHVLCVEVRPDA